MAANALIFDLDGTVWDSAAWFARALAEGDFDLENAFREELVGAGNIVRVLEREGLGRGAFLRRAEQKYGPPPLFPGIAEVLKEFDAAGVPLGVATSLPGSIALPMLQASKLDTKFSTVIHAGLCRSPKPSPTSINMALDRLEVEAGPDVYYVGDRFVDAEAARRAGISFAWMVHGYETPPDESEIVPLRSEELLKL